jgi:DNA recombination protein RmuC
VFLDPATAALIAAAAALLAAVLAALALRTMSGQAAELQRLRLLAEQGLAGQRSEAETLRRSLEATERALTTAMVSGQAEAMRGALTGIGEATTQVGATADRMRAEIGAALTDLRGVIEARVREMRESNEKKLGEIQASQTEAMRATATSIREAIVQVGATADRMRTEIGTALTDLRTVIEARVREMREGNEKKLGEIQASVNEQLHAAVEKQMTASFARVIDQFAAVQKAMGDVQAVTAQIGDIKRLFGNVKTRGGWGEAQVEAMLDDILPPGSWEKNFRPRAGSDEVVEFAVTMPMRGSVAPRLPIDAKFPVEDYERMVLAAEAGDGDGEREARRGLERAVREQAKKIAAKYIVPPATVEFAVMYLPTDGLYAEVARIPGLIDDLSRAARVLVLGPTLFPALLRTIQLGHVTLALEQKADEIRTLLGATRTEMQKMDDVLDRLGKQAGTMSNTIERARVRTRAIGRTLRGVETVEAGSAEALLGLGDGEIGEDAAPESE